MFRTCTWRPNIKFKELELQVIEACYLNNYMNKTKTAKELGISKRNLDAKIQKIEKTKTLKLPDYEIGDDLESQIFREERKEREERQRKEAVEKNKTRTKSKTNRKEKVRLDRGEDKEGPKEDL